MSKQCNTDKNSLLSFKTQLKWDDYFLEKFISFLNYNKFVVNYVHFIFKVAKYKNSHKKTKKNHTHKVESSLNS
jgi:hypothetical protein